MTTPPPEDSLPEYDNNGNGPYYDDGSTFQLPSDSYNSGDIISQTQSLPSTLKRSSHSEDVEPSAKRSFNQSETLSDGSSTAAVGPPKLLFPYPSSSSSIINPSPPVFFTPPTDSTPVPSPDENSLTPLSSDPLSTATLPDLNRVWQQATVDGVSLQTQSIGFKRNTQARARHRDSTGYVTQEEASTQEEGYDSRDKTQQGIVWRIRQFFLLLPVKYGWPNLIVYAVFALVTIFLLFQYVAYLHSLTHRGGVSASRSTTGTHQYSDRPLADFMPEVYDPALELAKQQQQLASRGSMQDMIEKLEGVVYKNVRKNPLQITQAEASRGKDAQATVLNDIINTKKTIESESKLPPLPSFSSPSPPQIVPGEIPTPAHSMDELPPQTALDITVPTHAKNTNPSTTAGQSATSTTTSTSPTTPSSTSPSSSPSPSSPSTSSPSASGNPAASPQTTFGRRREGENGGTGSEVSGAANASPSGTVAPTSPATPSSSPPAAISPPPVSSPPLSTPAASPPALVPLLTEQEAQANKWAEERRLRREKQMEKMKQMEEKEAKEKEMIEVKKEKEKEKKKSSNKDKTGGDDPKDKKEKWKPTAPTHSASEFTTLREEARAAAMPLPSTITSQSWQPGKLGEGLLMGDEIAIIIATKNNKYSLMNAVKQRWGSLVQNLYIFGPEPDQQYNLDVKIIEDTHKQWKPLDVRYHSWRVSAIMRYLHANTRKLHKFYLWFDDVTFPLIDQIASKLNAYRASHGGVFPMYAGGALSASTFYKSYWPQQQSKAYKLFSQVKLAASPGWMFGFSNQFLEYIGEYMWPENCPTLFGDDLAVAGMVQCAGGVLPSRMIFDFFSLKKTSPADPGVLQQDLSEWRQLDAYHGCKSSELLAQAFAAYYGKAGINPRQT